MDTFIKDGKELYPLISEGCREAGEDQYAVVALKDAPAADAVLLAMRLIAIKAYTRGRQDMQREINS